jgi:trimethylamine monooxygenase
MELKVAVIGAGLSGLCAAKHFKACPDIAEVKVFECRDDIGGQWYYSPLTDEETPADDLHKQLYGVTQSSMYEELYTRGPSELMSLEGLKGTFSRSYCNRREFLNYLKEYAQHFDLYRLISFNTAITLVNPLSSEELAVTTRDQQGREHTEVFNRVAVCIGNYSIPYIPDIEGISSFPGPVNHFKQFKQFRVEDFEGKTVVVVGGGPSAVDALTFLLVECQRATVVLSATSGLLLKGCLHEGLSRYLERCLTRPRIKTVAGSQVQFTDESVVTADEIILCTGYQLAFPFLPHQTVSEEGRYVDDLFKGIIDTKTPRIAHISLYKGNFVPIIEHAVKFVLQEWLKTPNVEAMRRELKEDEEQVRASGSTLHSIYDDAAFFSRLGLAVDQLTAEETTAIGVKHSQLIGANLLTFKQHNLVPYP